MLLFAPKYPLYQEILLLLLVVASSDLLDNERLVNLAWCERHIETVLLLVPILKPFCSIMSKGWETNQYLFAIIIFLLWCRSRRDAEESKCANCAEGARHHVLAQPNDITGNTHQKGWRGNLYLDGVVWTDSFISQSSPLTDNNDLVRHSFSMRLPGFCI